ncbi:putative membrane-anchored protein [Rhizobium sp. BK226]|uniref:DUF3422 domain-containing protein n=1 Tax=Rhizobium sp. BK226 TaxID=2587075 RepID=UPI00161668BB|nr:DUF3422 domain-containing protein [Rhizobium sp. BK226]MBB4117053.1 putative membrane-anchored protein [Rhizobium sp. BK226]
MTKDFNAELHARPSIYFAGPAIVEHIALMPLEGSVAQEMPRLFDDASARIQVEHHTEFVTVTCVRQIDVTDKPWPHPHLSTSEAERLAGSPGAKLISKVALLVLGEAPQDISQVLRDLDFKDTAASLIGGGSAVVCSDFRVGQDLSSRLILFNKDLNAYRLGRMVRRIYEIETYRAMALLGLPEARRLSPLLGGYDGKLVELTNRHLKTPDQEHKNLLKEISILSAEIISAAATTRNRFGATTAYAKIVEERISELRESHVPGFQRFGVFVARRFKPAIRTCEATAVRLDQLSRATMLLIDLLQTRIQVEIEFQNATQIQAMAERTATQVKIQRAVEGFSIIAISYYLLSLLKTVFETADHAGYHVNPLLMLVSIPIVIVAVALSILRVKHALKAAA